MTAPNEGAPPLWPGRAAEVRDELAARGLRLSKRFGQNFMIDPNLARSVARASGARDGGVVLEVGPGAGHLTAALLETGARVVAVEIDAGLARMLAERLSGVERFTLVHASALGRGEVIGPEAAAALEGTLVKAGSHSFSVASNLPYNIAATLLIALAHSGLRWERGAAVMQREVAERLTAAAGGKTYGAATVLWQLGAEARIERNIPREVFWPRPDVESALMTFEPKAEVEPVTGEPGFRDFVKSLFSMRRKTLRSALGGDRAEAAMRAAGLDPGSRAEVMTPRDFVRLYKALRDISPA